jgi:tetratricopeptide (TPR) repeat protein
MFEKVYEVQKRRLTEQHPDTLTTMNNLAGLYSDTGRLEAARDLYEKTIEERAKALDDSHTHSLQTKYNFMLLLFKMGKHLEASDKLIEIVQIVDDNKEEVYLEEPTWRSALIDYYISSRKWSDAEAHCMVLWRDCYDSFGSEHPMTLTALCKLGQVLNMQVKYPEARAYLEKGVEAASDILEVKDELWLTLNSLLAECLMMLGDFEQAERPAWDWYEASRALDYQNEIKKALGALNAMYIKWGKSDSEQAEKCRKLLDDIEKW